MTEAKLSRRIELLSAGMILKCPNGMWRARKIICKNTGIGFNLSVCLSTCNYSSTPERILYWTGGWGGGGGLNLGNNNTICLKL